MKKWYFIALALLVVVPVSVIAVAGTSVEQVQNGVDRRQIIVVELPASGGTNVTYLAETRPGEPVTSPTWVCSKITEISGETNTTFVAVIKGLEAPGTNGVLLSTLTYPGE